MEHFSDFPKGNKNIVPTAQHFAMQNAGRPMVAPTVVQTEIRSFGRRKAMEREFHGLEGHAYLCRGFAVFGENALAIRVEILVVKDHAKAKGQGCYQEEHREDHPEPGPVFFLAGILSHRNIAEEIRAEPGKEGADSVVFAGSPDVGGILVANGKQIIGTQRDVAQFALENLIEHDEQHQQQQSYGSGQQPFVGKLMVAQ